MPSVLVVDDTAIDRCLVEGILQRDRTLQVDSVPGAMLAIRRIEARVPDIVVTDLQMPDMNGLDLMTVIRERFPSLPVVLITAHGSEELAVRAIDEGAASYVPKMQLAERLLPTIAQVLEAARSDRGYQEFRSCLHEARLRFVVGTQTNVLDKIVDVARGMAASVGLCSDTHEQLRLDVALQGLLSLCLYAGNLELPPEQLDALDVPDSPLQALVAQRREELPYFVRRLHVEIDLSRLKGQFAVRHEGPPFDPSILTPGPRRDFPCQYRGLVMFKAFADEVALVDNGQTIVMVRQQQAGPGT